MKNNSILKDNTNNGTTKSINSWSANIPKPIKYHSSIIEVKDDIKINLISETTTKRIKLSKDNHKDKRVEASLRSLQNSIDKLF